MEMPASDTWVFVGPTARVTVTGSQTVTAVVNMDAVAAAGTDVIFQYMLCYAPVLGSGSSGTGGAPSVDGGSVGGGPVDGGSVDGGSVDGPLLGLSSGSLLNYHLGTAPPLPSVPSQLPTPPDASFAAAGAAQPGAGTFDVGFCVNPGGAVLVPHAVNGWVMVTN
jgi:hypothetical protein